MTYNYIILYMTKYKNKGNYSVSSDITAVAGCVSICIVYTASRIDIKLVLYWHAKQSLLNMSEV